MVYLTITNPQHINWGTTLNFSSWNAAYVWLFRHMTEEDFDKCELSGVEE